jgi:hypothetical protein
MTGKAASSIHWAAKPRITLRSFEEIMQDAFHPQWKSVAAPRAMIHYPDNAA